MRITEGQLRRIIRQEVKALRESVAGDPAQDGALRAIERALSISPITPEDVMYMTFQPRRSGGVINSVNLTYKDPDAGSYYADVLPGDVEEGGITFDEFMASVQQMGAKSRARRPARKPSMPYYD